MNRIAEAKSLLPLPQLMERLGLGNRAKKSARCPFHDDQHNSFSVWQNCDGWAWKCHAGCGNGDEINFIELHEALPRKDATKRFLELAGVNGATPKSTPTFDWPKCNAAFADKRVEQVAKWRGFSPDFVRELRDGGHIGIYYGLVAFPVHNNGKIVGTHFRLKDGTWNYAPSGIKAAPFVFGDLIPGERVNVFESTWDGLDYMNKSGERDGVIIARGAGNARLAAVPIPQGSTIYVWTQNDKAGADFEKELVANARCAVKRCKIPAPHKDLNDWTRVGATTDDLIGAMQNAEVLREAGDDDLTSLKSLARAEDDEAVEDFPEPLSEVAFHGLAGDIVRRIEPHTEADRAALLIQILTAFGNVIGHDAFAIADGSRHAMNLFCVPVGESSKSRKGTSQQHVLRIFGRADEDWRKNCIVNGLSSGEGLIWAVRDEITRTVEDKKTRERKTELVDAGIADKRLCVTEGEFANVLKVMTREGNTLSPVIRASWDSGNLRTLTKNSPARASDAHISIIGHITNCELRRLLTETESANGFGNRFLWVAVRRSKCLPEGGNIDSENLNDLVARLHTAIEFARNAGEVTRDDAARELWRIVYPELSEGEPGLLGAITARAEAQVLRLSCIYALLDCSTQIKPEHHQAALALWNYCDRSARWIFGTATGDSNADRILIALRAVGSTGMTRKQILDDVFQRNVSGKVLAAALQSLRPSKLAYCRTEPTGGKPRERWFATKREAS